MLDKVNTIKDKIVELEKTRTQQSEYLVNIRNSATKMAAEELIVTKNLDIITGALSAYHSTVGILVPAETTAVVEEALQGEIVS